MKVCVYYAIMSLYIIHVKGNSMLSRNVWTINIRTSSSRCDSTFSSKYSCWIEILNNTVHFLIDENNYIGKYTIYKQKISVSLTGYDRFFKDIECMIGQRPYVLWKYTWKYISPAVIVVSARYGWFWFTSSRQSWWWFFYYIVTFHNNSSHLCEGNDHVIIKLLINVRTLRAMFDFYCRRWWYLVGRTSRWPDMATTSTQTGPMR